MDQRKKNNKNCMILHCKNAEMTIIFIAISAFLQCKIIQFLLILHCKNAEMTIILSFLHFYSVKSYNFCYFFYIFFSFLNLAVFYIGENKKSQK